MNFALPKRFFPTASIFGFLEHQQREAENKLFAFEPKLTKSNKNRWNYRRNDEEFWIGLGSTVPWSTVYSPSTGVAPGGGVPFPCRTYSPRS
jgi:hypothetical protein